MTAQAFAMLNDSKRMPTAVKGATVYACFYDYGLANDDTRATGIPHISVTLDPEGGNPFFTVPVADLEAIPR